MPRTNINYDKIFSNGTYIFDKRGQQIDPKEQEGKLIESILNIQHKTKKEIPVKKEIPTKKSNKKQTKKFERTVQKDTDVDGKTG